MISVQEYKQFKAYARFDGALLGVVMSVAFFLFIYSVAYPSFQIWYIIAMIFVPVFAALRVRNYRDKVVKTRVSKMRVMGYSMTCFIYASLVLALMVFLYFQFVDKGFFLSHLHGMFSTEEMRVAMKAYGLDKVSLEEQLRSFEELRPVDVALSMVWNAFFAGIFCSILVALFTRREPRLQRNSGAGSYEK